MAWKTWAFGGLRSAEFWALQAELKDLKAAAGKAGHLAASKLEHVRALHCEAEAAAEAASDQLCQEETAHAATRKKLVRSITLSTDCQDSVSRGCSTTCSTPVHLCVLQYIISRFWNPGASVFFRNART